MNILRKNFNSHGFTILELLTTVVILAAVVTLAAPNLAQFMERRQIQLQASNLNDAFNTSRALALSSGLGVQVCWNLGGAVNNLADQNSVVVVQTDADGAQSVVKRLDLASDGYNISDTGTAGSCISYDSQGRTSSGVVFGVCKTDGDIMDLTSVRITNTGRPSIIRADKDNPNPNNFSCT